MTHEIIQSFYDHLCSHGCTPHSIADIIPDGEDRHIRLAKDKRDKRLGYCLSVEADGFAHANYVNFDDNVKGSWHSGKANKTITPDERKANEARLKALREAQATRTAERHAKAAAEAKTLWDSLQEAKGHEYLTRKGIQPHGARLDGQDLILQAISGGRICTYQRIAPDGGKLFLTGGKKSGTFYPFTTATESKDVICIAEGWATAASIREACGLPVLAAWDAGNLVNVAKDMRQKYPQAIIVIAGDNDAYGEKNTGLIAAQQAALKVKGFSVVPEFEDLTDAPTDWNDAHRIYGLEHVKNKILAVVDSARAAASILSIPHSVDVQTGGGDYIPPTEEELGLNLVPIDAPSGVLAPVFDDNKISNTLIWKKFPREGDKGKLEPNSLHNIGVYLRHGFKYTGLFRYDKFAGRIILHREPFWHSGGKFKVRELQDNDTSYITASMEQDGLAPSSSKVREAIGVVATENWINPPLEYFNKLAWDKTPRLKQWLRVYLGADGEADYLSAVGMAFLVAGVARIYSPGCKAENMLVLEGNQGLLKSTALNVLANVGRGDDEESYFCDTLGFDQIQDKDTVMKLQGKLIVEIPDLAGLGNREIEAVKAWMSVQVDEIRVPYGREMAKFPRQFILAGSTNESHWLKDQTGNRRFWPVRCGKIDIEALKRDREQLWAEAVYLFKNKAQWWIGRDNPLWKTVEIEQGDRLLEEPWHHPISRIVGRLNFITVNEIFDGLKIEIKDRSGHDQKKIINILRRLGFQSKKKRVNGEPQAGWERIVNVPEVIEPEFQEIEF